MLIRREIPTDIEAIREIHAAAFARADRSDQIPVEVGLVDALRADSGWIPQLSLVAVIDGVAAGHVVCTRATIGPTPALGLGPLGVLPDYQGKGVGSALMHAVLGAADALDEAVVVLLGHTDYYPRFGFCPATEYGIEPPVTDWGAHFQARTLTAYQPSVRGTFAYAEPFTRL